MKSNELLIKNWELSKHRGKGLGLGNCRHSTETANICIIAGASWWLEVEHSPH